MSQSDSLSFCCIAALAIIIFLHNIYVSCLKLTVMIWVSTQDFGTYCHRASKAKNNYRKIWITVKSLKRPLKNRQNKGLNDKW